MRHRWTILLAAVAVMAAACGSGSESDGVASLDDTAAPAADAAPEQPEMTGEEAMFALAECLREQGFEVADPEIADDGRPRMRSLFRDLMEAGRIDREQVDAAMEACREYADLITTEFAPEDRSVIEDQMYEYAACMRENGYDMPDPTFDREPGQGQGGGPFGSLDRDDPAFQAAQEACRDLFVGGGPGGGPGGGGGRPPGDGA